MSPALPKCSLDARFGNEGQPKWLHLEPKRLQNGVCGGCFRSPKPPKCC